jgi:hypothetical protein
MASDQFGVVHTANNIIIAIIETEGDADNSALDRREGRLAQGYKLTRLNHTDHPVKPDGSGRRVTDLQPHIGMPAHSGRCVIVRDGNVVATAQADPAVWQSELGTLIQHDQADVGWIYKDGTFSPPAA